MAKRLFFTFHQDDVVELRASVPRDCWIAQDRAEVGYFDTAVWESAKKKGDVAVKSLIDIGLKTTSVTAVLIGTKSFERPWVRYAIVRSCAVGNRVIGIHINGIANKDGETKPPGRDPFDSLALHYSVDGMSVVVKEAVNSSWVVFAQYPLWRLKQPVAPEKRGRLYPFSQIYKVYDWVGGNGAANLASWVDN